MTNYLHILNSKPWKTILPYKMSIEKQNIFFFFLNVVFNVLNLYKLHKKYILKHATFLKQWVSFKIITFYNLLYNTLLFLPCK